MLQWKEKSDKSGHCNQYALLGLLESPDPATVESVKNAIQDSLCSCRDSRLLNNLVDFYVATQSKRSLDILLHVKDPHEKHIFDKLNEMMKNEPTRYNALQLLGNIIYKQPSWLYKIASHRVLHTLLLMLKTDVNFPNLLSGLFIVICLLPIVPHQFGSFLSDTFHIFSRLAAWNIKKQSSLSDILNLHLQTGIYSLFHRLYGMFPCNFLAYLRSFYGGRDCTDDSFKVFSLVIKPMLERVRLHPLLVTASKEAELNVNRWKKMAYHDIIVDCASISLDMIEGTLEGFRNINLSISAHSEENSSYESANNFNNASVIVDSGFTTNDNKPSSQECIWSPFQESITAMPPLSNTLISPSPTTGKGEWEFRNVMHSSTEESIPLDFAVEAKPEILKSCLESSELLASKDINHENDEICLEAEGADTSGTLLEFGIHGQLNNNSLDPTLTNQGNYLFSLVTSKDDAVDKEMSDLLSSQILEHTLCDVDREVSDLTSSQILESSVFTDEIRHNTPFCSTTQNLTDEPANLPQTLSERSNSVSKIADEDVDEMYNSMQEGDMQSFDPPFCRFPYFSHCAPPSVLVPSVKKPKAFRSISCPAKLCPPTSNNNDNIKNSNGVSSVKTETVVVSSSSNVIATTTPSAFVPLTSENSLIDERTLQAYQQLWPAVANPVQGFEQSVIIGLPSNPSESRNLKNLSPPELLDFYYIQQGSIAYLNNLPLTSTKDTDWIHFGGKPPPEEIEILRNQILLLHNMLLFERHRKDIHSERNRRILGRAKRMRMQEEYVEALKKEIVILTEENGQLKAQLSKQYNLYQQLQVQKKMDENEKDAKYFKIDQENTQLLFSNKQLQTLLVSQKEENDEIREMYKKTQSDVINIKCQLKFANKEVQHCQRIKREAIFLTKQLTLLQELNSQYKTKIEQMKEPQLPDIGTELLNKAIHSEMKDLKQKLDTKMIQLDSLKGKIIEFENVLLSTKLAQKEKASLFENMKSFHQAEIMVREDRLRDFKKISLEKDAHILKLYADLDELRERNVSLEQKLQGSLTINSESSGYKFPDQIGDNIGSINQKADEALS